MKEFFKRHGIDLEVEDIARYARILIDDLGLVLKGEDFRVHLLDNPGQETRLDEAQREALTEKKVLYEHVSRRLHLPVIYDGRSLALVSISMLEGFDLPEDAYPLILLAVKQSLEKILLYKINITDRETGLYNDYYFQGYLNRELKSLLGRGDGQKFPKPLSFSEEGVFPGLTLLLVEIDQFSDLTATHGRIEADRALRAVSRKLLAAASPSGCAARLSSGRLGLIMPHQDLQAGLEAAKAIQDLPESFESQKLPRLKLGFGLAGYPVDFTDEFGQADAVTGNETDLAEALTLKAELALRQALNDKEKSIFTYADILKQGARIVQVLPLNRVVINIGRTAGARVGQVFTLSEIVSDNDLNYKGEVVLSEVEDDFSVGRTINLLNPLNMVKPGDTLRLSQKAGEDWAAAILEEKERLDPLLGIPAHFNFVRQLDNRLQGQDKFAIILIRVDGYDSYRQTMGRLLSDQKIKALYDLLQEDMPEGALTGRFSADCLAVFCPDLDKSAAETLVETWLDKIKTRNSQTASLGLALYPCGSFSPPEILTNAQKALEHASFFGPASKATFDAVSLNISGDKFFASGDLKEAIAEFEKALTLDPDDVNVLNSLGVCYGHEHQVDQALECFQRVLDLDPRNLMAHFNRGFALSMAGRPEEALESFRRAVEIDGQNFDALFQMGVVALEVGRVDEAVESFSRAEKVEGSRPVLYKYLGESLLRAGRDEEAIRALKAAVRFDPRDAASMSQLGVLFMDRGTDPEVALSLTRQSVELDQTNPTYRERLARALYGVGNLAEAEVEYGRALEMGGQSREVHYNLGQVIREQGRLDEAAAAFKRALELDPQYHPALRALKEVQTLLAEKEDETQAEIRT